MENTNLNPLFIDQIINFGHLVTIDSQTKEQFLNTVKKTYNITNPKTELFYQSILKSKFNTIRLSQNRNSILFNH